MKCLCRSKTNEDLLPQGGIVFIYGMDADKLASNIASALPAKAVRLSLKSEDAATLQQAISAAHMFAGQGNLCLLDVPNSISPISLKNQCIESRSHSLNYPIVSACGYKPPQELAKMSPPELAANSLLEFAINFQGFGSKNSSLHGKRCLHASDIGNAADIITDRLGGTSDAHMQGNLLRSFLLTTFGFDRRENGTDVFVSPRHDDDAIMIDSFPNKPKLMATQLLTSILRSSDVLPSSSLQHATKSFFSLEDAPKCPDCQKSSTLVFGDSSASRPLCGQCLRLLSNQLLASSHSLGFPAPSLNGTNVQRSRAQSGFFKNMTEAIKKNGEWGDDCEDRDFPKSCGFGCQLALLITNKSPELWCALGSGRIRFNLRPHLQKIDSPEISGLALLAWSHLAFGLFSFEGTEQICSSQGFRFFTLDFALVGESDDCVVIAFRGSDSFKVLIETDLLPTLSPSVDAWETYVHSGFASHLDKIYFQLLEFLASELGDRKLFITGHSLGGALCHLMTARLYAKFKFEEAGLHESLNFTPFATYSFGSPRVGGPSFARKSNESFQGRYFRYINQFDFICDSPEMEFGGVSYRHAGTPKCIQNNFNKCVDNFTDQLNPVCWGPHVPYSYFRFLEETINMNGFLDSDSIPLNFTTGIDANVI